MKSELNRAIGNELRKLRVQHELSREDAAARLENPVHAQTLAMWERGDREIQLSKLVSYCRGYNVSVTALIGRALKRAGL